MSENLEKSAVTKGLEKVNFHSNPKEGRCQIIFKLPYDCAHFTCQQGNVQNLPSQVSAVPELGTYKYTSWVQKGRGTRDQIVNIHWIMEKAREFQKKSTSASVTTLKPLTVQITANCGKFLKRWECHTTFPVS